MGLSTFRIRTTGLGPEYIKKKKKKKKKKR